MKVTERFSDRVENYIKYRPHYPLEIIPFLSTKIGLTPSSVVADIGSGTGISAEMFLNNGNTVYGIEPNKEMRKAGENQLKDFSIFRSIAGTAEETTLPDSSIDIIVAGQAFHWFKIHEARSEFKRILKPGGWIVLIWNEREINTSPFLQAYEDLLHTFGTDYQEVNHVNVYGTIDQLFDKHGFQVHRFPNQQIFDYDGLRGRLLSSSYTPSPDDFNYLPMLGELQKIFDKNKQDNTVIFEYTTKVFYGQL